MRKKLLIAAAIVVVLAGAAVLIFALRGGSDDQTDRVYGLYDELAITDCEGDTDILKAEAVVNRMYGANRYVLLSEPRIKIRFSAAKPVAFTSAAFKDGKIEGLGYWDSGTVERLEDGEWVKYGALKVYGSDLGGFFDNNRSAPYSHLTPDSDCVAMVNLPVTEPGKYRLTYTFRDSLSYDDWSYTTGEEVYSISHTITIPDATENRYDVAHVFFGETPADCTVDGQRAAFVAERIVPIVRANDGSAFYYDRASYRLEAKIDGEWVDAPLPERMVVSLRDNNFVEVARPDEVKSAVLTKCIEDSIQSRFLPSDDSDYHLVDLCIADPTLEYRLSFDVVTDRDPNAERTRMQVLLSFEGLETVDLP